MSPLLLWKTLPRRYLFHLRGEFVVQQLNSASLCSRGQGMQIQAGVPWHTLADKTLLTFKWTFISVFALTLTVNATSANIKTSPAGKSGEMGIFQLFFNSFLLTMPVRLPLLTSSQPDSSKYIQVNHSK